MSSDYNKKSTPEINVKEYLKRKEIEYRYEVPVCVLDEDGRLRLWYPDFYLPKLGLYLEVCGSESRRLEKLRREHVYEDNEIPVIFLHYYKGDSMWKGFFENEAERIQNNRLVELGKLKSS